MPGGGGGTKPGGGGGKLILSTSLVAVEKRVEADVSRASDAVFVHGPKTVVPSLSDRSIYYMYGFFDLVSSVSKLVER
jgi:hypothetical protein